MWEPLLPRCVQLMFLAIHTPRRVMFCTSLSRQGASVQSGLTPLRLKQTWRIHLKAVQLQRERRLLLLLLSFRFFFFFLRGRNRSFLWPVSCQSLSTLGREQRRIVSTDYYLWAKITSSWSCIKGLKVRFKVWVNYHPWTWSLLLQCSPQISWNKCFYKSGSGSFSASVSFLREKVLKSQTLLEITEVI